MSRSRIFRHQEASVFIDGRQVVDLAGPESPIRLNRPDAVSELTGGHSWTTSVSFNPTGILELDFKPQSITLAFLEHIYNNIQRSVSSYRLFPIEILTSVRERFTLERCSLITMGSNPTGGAKEEKITVSFTSENVLSDLSPSDEEVEISFGVDVSF